MKRFYDKAHYTEENGKYLIHLDARTISTPANNTLLCDTAELADIVCEEWNAQIDSVKPETMPVTQYCYTALDYVPLHRDEIMTTILKFLDTDLVCYRTDDPTDLSELQSKNWDPYIDWFQEKFGLKLKTTHGLMAITHDAEAHEALKTYVNQLDNHKLTILQALTAACGSIIMALCFVEGGSDKDAMFKASFVEELYQGAIYDEDRYGIDPTQEKQRKRLRIDLEAAETYLKSLNLL